MDIDKFHLSLVSGGKPSLARNVDTPDSKKNSTLLSDDLTHYVIPFNNQIKIYSTETKHCVKTIKFPNHEVLNTVFMNDDVKIVHFAFGDMTKTNDTIDNELLSIVTNTGSLLVLNLKGKLVEDPKHLNISAKLNDPKESISKILLGEATKQIKLITSKVNSDNTLAYYLYDCSFEDNISLTCTHELQNVQNISWSNNNLYLSYLVEQPKSKGSSKTEKIFKCISIFDDSLNQEFDLSIILPSTTVSQSSNSKTVSTIAIDNNGIQLAVGFFSGVITIVDLADLQTRLLKWHIDSVLSLTFTDDGSYLLSGGWEKVLSFWQLATNMQQFLPRLNGVIVDIDTIGNGKFYSLTLQLTENVTSADYQILLLNAADLTSVLSITGPLAVFSSETKNSKQPLSSMNTKTSESVSSSVVSKKKLKKKLLKNKRQDFTVPACINPVSKQIYFPHMSAIQVYDFYKNEPIAYQYVTSAVAGAMGKVRTELNIQEPLITEVQFTKDGKWMITQETEFPPEDLPSSKDLNYILKFWNKESGEGDWQLKTKVLNPHGLAVPITKILVAPSCINNSEGCLTADNNGGLKYWSFEKHEKNWCLTKVSLPNFNHFSNSVSLAWSSDGSLIFHGFDDKLQVIEFDTLRKFESSFSELTFDFEIQALLLSNDKTLVVATKTTLYAFDILAGAITHSYDLFPYIDGVYKNTNISRLLACNSKSGQIALVVNQQVEDESNNKTLNYKSSIIIFSADLSERVGSYSHDEYISCIEWNYESDFIFMDIQSRLGVVGATVSTEMSDEVNNEGVFDGLYHESGNSFHEELKKLSSQKVEAENVDTEDKNDVDLEFINGNFANKAINMNSFTSMMDNIQNIQMESLFDRVMKVLK